MMTARSSSRCSAVRRRRGRSRRGRSSRAHAARRRAGGRGSDDPDVKPWLKRSGRGWRSWLDRGSERSRSSIAGQAAGFDRFPDARTRADRAQPDVILSQGSGDHCRARSEETPRRFRSCSSTRLRSRSGSASSPASRARAATSPAFCVRARPWRQVARAAQRDGASADACRVPCQPDDPRTTTTVGRLQAAASSLGAGSRARSQCEQPARHRARCSQLVGRASRMAVWSCRRCSSIVHRD